MRIGVTLALSLLLAADAASQRTIQVFGGGAALSLALRQALPGDTLDVLPADYDAVDVSVGIRLLFRPGARIRSATSGAGLRVLGVPASQRLLIRGLRFVGTPLEGPLIVRGCAGSVTFDDVDLAPSGVFQATFLLDNPGPILFRRVFDSRGQVLARLRMLRCEQVSLVGSPQLPPLQIEGSRVLICDSMPAGAGIPLWARSGASVMLTDVQVDGSSSGAVWAPAARIENSELTLTGRSILTGGPSPSNPRTEAIAALDATLRIAPSARLVSLRADPISGTAVVTRPSMPATSATGVAPGVLEVLTRGVPGDSAWTLLSHADAASASPWGPLWFAPDAVIVAAGVLPSDGIQTLRIAYPPTAADAVITAQAVAWSASTGLVTGGATRTLLD